MLNRRGVTLVELLVAITLAAIILASATATVARQRRGADDHASRIRAESQLRASLAELQVALGGLSATAGDLVAGEARDTAVQLRTVVASGVACDSGAGRAVLAADDTSDARAAGVAAAPKSGDSLWWRPPGASTWTARPVTDVSTSTAACAATGGAAQTLLWLTFAASDTVPRGAPVRLTRQARLAFYRAGDGTWQLGLSEWSEVLHAFASPQPVAGPFTLVAPDGSRTAFHYFDAGGGELPIGPLGVGVAKVARIRVGLIAPVFSPGGSVASYRRDSVDVAVGDAP